MAGEKCVFLTHLISLPGKRQVQHKHYNLIWNERTGNLVSGHQRLSWIDLKAREKGLKDFDIDVNKVDIDEMELNLAMNNDAAMGKFDLDMLGADV